MYLTQYIYRTGSRNIATFNKETDQVTMRGLDNVGLSKDEWGPKNIQPKYYIYGVCMIVKWHDQEGQIFHPNENKINQF